MDAWPWTCLLQLLYIPAGLASDVSQHPSVVSLTVNSSAEVLCTTSLPEPMGLSLHSHFGHTGQVVYLFLENKRVRRTTTSPHLHGRFNVVPNPKPELGYGLTLRLSLLGLTDTDIYRCRWTYVNVTTATKESIWSKGTLVIVRERDPEKRCDGQEMEMIVVGLSMAVVFVTPLLFTAVVAWKCAKFRKVYRPMAHTPRPKPRTHNQTYPQQTSPQVYSDTAPGRFDFRGIL